MIYTLPQAIKALYELKQEVEGIDLRPIPEEKVIYINVNETQDEYINAFCQRVSNIKA